MKTILILFYLVYFARAQDRLDSRELGGFSDYEKECIKYFNLDENVITQALKEPYMPEDNPQYNEFMECTWKKDGFIDEYGNISYERLYYYVKGAYMDAVGIPELAEAFSKDVIAHCKQVQGTSPGQISVKFVNCIIRRLYVD